MTPKTELRQIGTQYRKCGIVWEVIGHEKSMFGDGLLERLQAVDTYDQNPIPPQEGMAREYCNCGRVLCGNKEKQNRICSLCNAQEKIDNVYNPEYELPTHKCDSLIDIPVVAHRCNTCGRLHIYEVIPTVGAPYKLRKVGTIEVPDKHVEWGSKDDKLSEYVGVSEVPE